MKKLSVIVPVYNVEKYIKHCVDTILTQTYTNLEVILVDDGSKDSSGIICDEYARKDERIVVIHKENGGLSDARNAGIDVSTGDYLAFIDSDDYIDVTMFQTMIESLEATDSDIALCNFDYVDEMGNLIDEKNEGIRVISEELTSQQALDKLCKAFNSYYVIACNKIYKKDIFKELRFRKGKVHEDEFIVHEVFERMKKMICLETPFYKYVQRGNSISNANYTSRHLDKVEALLIRTLFFISIKKDYNAKHTFGMATGTFIDLMGKIQKKDDSYNERVRELSCMCKEVYGVVPKKYFRIKLWMKSVLVMYFPKLVKPGKLMEFLVS